MVPIRYCRPILHRRSQEGTPVRELMNPVEREWLRFMIENIVRDRKQRGHGYVKAQYIRSRGSTRRAKGRRQRDLERYLLKTGLTDSVKEGMIVIMQEVFGRALHERKPISPWTVELLKRLAFSRQYHVLRRTLCEVLKQRKALRGLDSGGTLNPPTRPKKSRKTSKQRSNRSARCGTADTSPSFPAGSRTTAWTKEFEDNFTLAMKFTLFPGDCDENERKTAASLLATNKSNCQDSA